jgi:hypothetical protein
MDIASVKQRYLSLFFFFSTTLKRSLSLSLARAGVLSLFVRPGSRRGRSASCAACVLGPSTGAATGQPTQAQAGPPAAPTAHAYTSAKQRGTQRA